MMSPSSYLELLVDEPTGQDTWHKHVVHVVDHHLPGAVLAIRYCLPLAETIQPWHYSRIAQGQESWEEVNHVEQPRIPA